MRDLLNFLFSDHAIFRPLWPNLEKITRDAWRSSQPTQRTLKKLKKHGIKHVLRLRGNNNSVNFKYENAACNILNLKLTVIPLSANNTVSKEKLTQLLDFFDETTEPFVMHCKSGADRTSLAAAFYLIYKCGTPIVHARKQMSPWYLHFKWTKTGILDFMLDEFERFINQNPDKDLRYWVTYIYDAETLKNAFNATRLENGKSIIK